MEKKESRKKEAEAQPKTAGLPSRLFGIIKFILGICLLPFIYSVSVSFLNEFGLLEEPQQNYFWAGLVTLVIVYLFIWEPAIIYAKGQRVLEIIFSFFKPLVKIAPYLLPIYASVIFILYWALSLISKSPNLIGYFLFLFGASIGLHLVFGAKSLRLRQADFLKANYIFGFSFIYIINAMLVAFILNLIFEKFSVVNFLNNSFKITWDIFAAIFKQLFL